MRLVDVIRTQKVDIEVGWTPRKWTLTVRALSLCCLDGGISILHSPCFPLPFFFGHKKSTVETQSWLVVSTKVVFEGPFWDPPAKKGQVAGRCCHKRLMHHRVCRNWPFATCCIVDVHHIGLSAVVDISSKDDHVGNVLWLQGSIELRRGLPLRLVADGSQVNVYCQQQFLLPFSPGRGQPTLRFFLAFKCFIYCKEILQRSHGLRLS